jgi:hypothetical protein
MVTVYALKCVSTEEVYIGCTAGKLGKRMREHRCLLNAGRHKAVKLQDRWKMLGPSGFRLIVVEALPNDADVILKRERELYWMRFFLEKDLLLNTHLVSYSPLPGSSQKAAESRVRNGYRPSAESNLKRRLAQLGVPKGHGAKISATKRARAMR